MELINNYHNVIAEDIVPFVGALVKRVISELKICHEKGEKNNLVINKTWNIIRQVVEIDSFIPEFYEPIEETLKPLFEYILNPENIEFEDDIVLVMKTFIKKSKNVSTTLWTIYPHLMKVFEKNKRSFGNLLDTLNQFLLHGRNEFINDRNKLALLVQMGTLSMFSTESNVTV